MIRVALLCATLAGCALVPNTVRPEFEHMSHASQHAPFTDSPTNYGVNIVSVVLHWDLPQRFSVEIAEGASIGSRTSPATGEIIGPREQFSLRVGYSFTVRP